MLNNRPKNGEINIDWRTLALSARKYQRKTINLSQGTKRKQKYHLRELSIVSGGLGCALWDGGVVLARWVHENLDTIFAGKSVIELGAGVGLAGIVAAEKASRVILTDYLPTVVENLEYNVKINSRDPEESGDDRPEIAAKCICGRLDWDTFATEVEQLNGSEDSGDRDKHLKCTRYVYGKKSFAVQPWRRCLTCFPDDDACGICVDCAEQCHMGHEIGPIEDPSRFRCDCASPDRQDDSGNSELACLLDEDMLKNMEIDEPCDIAIGAELTYNLLSVKTLPVVIDRVLKPGGVFYEVLSEDRDGVVEFIAECERRGFEVQRLYAPERLCGNYNTRDWSLQDAEKYTFLTVRKPGCTMPVMGREDEQE
eukprot:Clim_evm25s148 gene=Clim_evmTU25s148